MDILVALRRTLSPEVTVKESSLLTDLSKKEVLELVITKTNLNQKIPTGRKGKDSRLVGDNYITVNREKTILAILKSRSIRVKT